jgi:hypothetical protein
MLQSGGKLPLEPASCSLPRSGRVGDDDRGRDVDPWAVGDAVAQGAKPAARGTLTQLAWLAGTWDGANGSLAFEERWTSPAGGAMLAVPRTLKAETFVFRRQP